MNKIWLNGALLPADEARIAPNDRGFLLGDGLFETMAAHNGAVPELHRHYARLTTGAAVLRIPVPLTLAALHTAAHSLLEANGAKDATLRLTLTRGPGPRGLAVPADTTPTLLITAAPLPPPGGPMTLITASILRDETSPLSRIKTLNYLPGVLARIEAADAGADDALLLNHQGYVAETSAATLFVLCGEHWLTPPVTDGALPGILRKRLLEAGRVQEARLTRAQLFQAAGIFVGNALLLRPVIALDGQPIPLADPAALS